jgi:hypothetical protein
MKEHITESGEYSLSDEVVGISVHDKLDASLKAKLIEEALKAEKKPLKQ